MSTPAIVLTVALLFCFLLSLVGSKISEEFKTIGLIIGVIAVLASLKWYVSFRLERYQNYKTAKTCLERIDKITSAVETYNNDAFVIMENLDIQRLLKRNLIEPFESECEYTNEGNLYENGKVVCKKHGDVNKLKDLLIKLK